MYETGNHDKEGNQGKGEDEEDDLSYLDRPMITYSPRTIPKQPTGIMVWLRSLLGRQPKCQVSVRTWLRTTCLRTCVYRTENLSKPVIHADNPLRMLRLPCYPAPWRYRFSVMALTI